MAARALATDALEQSLATCPGLPQKAEVVVKPTLMFLGRQFTIFAKLQRKIGSGFLGLRSGALGRAGILLLGQRTFAGLVV